MFVFFLQASWLGVLPAALLFFGCMWHSEKYIKPEHSHRLCVQFLWAVGGSLRSVSAPWIYLASVTLRGHSPQKLFPLNAPTRRVYNVVKHFELGAIVRFLCGPKYKLVLQSFLETELSRNILYKCLGSRHVSQNKHNAQKRFVLLQHFRRGSFWVVSKCASILARFPKIETDALKMSLAT